MDRPNMIILAYVPVLHEGYHRLFTERTAKSIYIFGPDLIRKYRPLQKDIRALPPYLIATAIKSWNISGEVFIASEESLSRINGNRSYVVMPDEDVSRDIAEIYLSDCRVEFISIFLRWDSKKTLARVEIPCDREVEADDFARSIMDLAKKEAAKSPDWWRRIGAVAVKNGQILIATFNSHVPSSNHVFSYGDPRANFKKGLHFELSPALHAEAAIVAEAARNENISLEGADLYVTIFPCPPCAKVVAHSGIKRLFFLEGYAVYDGVDVLHSKEIEIIRLKL